jgi:hypothetical protein
MGTAEGDTEGVSDAVGVPDGVMLLMDRAL